MGFLTTRSNISLELAARIFILCNSWTIRPEKRLKVRGIRILGDTSINTFVREWMKTCGGAEVRRLCG